MGAGTALGGAALAWSSLNQSQAAAGQFERFKPMRPAPEINRGSVPLPPPMAALVLNKAAFGPRPGDIAAFNALGGDDFTRLSAWVDQQLNPTVGDPDLDSRLNPLLGAGLAYDTINKTPQQLWLEHHRYEGGNEEYSVRNRPRWQMETLMLLRATWSQWQLREVLHDFWSNHFNVLGRNNIARSMLPNYDSVIRQNIFGNFGDMLEANARTATMLYYLDNYANSWPNPNENYAREVLELHTLGAIENYYAAVDPSTVPDNGQGQRAGYTEIDVMQFARALTGWGVEDDDDGGIDTGDFVFRPGRHYDFSDGPIEVMDITINATGGEADVTDILTYLKGHYGTARYISWKLCTRLIGDNPPESIVSSTADQFFTRSSDPDQLKEVYRHVLLSNEFQTTWGSKVKRPIEVVVKALRSSSADLTLQIEHSESNEIMNRLDETGHFPFANEAPTGFPDEREIWQGSGPLITTWRTVTRLLRNSNTLNLADQTNTGIPVSANRTPQAVIDFWIDRALGYPLQTAVRDRMVTFVTDISGVGITDPLDNATDIDTTDTGSSSRYQRIVRALVGLVVMSPDAMRR